MNFDDFYNRALKNENSPMWRNGQTYILGDSASEAALAKIEEQVQEGRLILLVTERFEESCIVLERLFPNLHERQQYVDDFVQRCLSKE